MTADTRIRGGPVLAIGEVLIDFIVDDGATSLAEASSFLARSGGAPANVAVALARLGVASAFCGVAGEDPFGARLTRELGREGVDTTRLRRSRDAATTLAYAWKDRRGDGHFWLLRGADTLLNEADVEGADIAKLACLVLGSVSLAEPGPRAAIQRAVEIAAGHDVPVVFDVNLRPAVWPDVVQARPLCEEIARSSRIVKLSLDDARGLFGEAVTPTEAVERVLAFGPPSVVLTDGERGCWFATRSAPVPRFVPAFSVDAVEPTGAGDAFLAALIARLLENGWVSPCERDVRVAAAAGALATMKRGAWDGLPNRAQLTSFMASS